MKEKENIEFRNNSENSSDINNIDNFSENTVPNLEELEHKSKKIEAARESIENIESNINSEAVLGTKEHSPYDNAAWTSKELLAQTYTNTLRAVRSRLRGPEKSFSKLIHQPRVEKASDFLGKTAARPLGIIFGSAFSLIGSFLGYILAKRIGGEMPNTIFAYLFLVGYIFGLFFELIWRFIKVKKSKKI